MHESFRQEPGTCRRIDLAAVDAAGAATFYREMFGWSARPMRANGGAFFEFSAQGRTVASMYQLEAARIAQGVPSHWTPYVGIADLDESVARAIRLGGAVIVRPFEVDGVARVSLVVDSGGALLGLWELPA
jgi:uncharacterized protein